MGPRTGPATHRKDAREAKDGATLSPMPGEAGREGHGRRRDDVLSVRPWRMARQGGAQKSRKIAAVAHYIILASGTPYWHPGPRTILWSVSYIIAEYIVSLSY